METTYTHKHTHPHMHITHYAMMDSLILFVFFFIFPFLFEMRRKAKKRKRVSCVRWESERLAPGRCFHFVCHAIARGNTVHKATSAIFSVFQKNMPFNSRHATNKSNSLNIFQLFFFGVVFLSGIIGR